MYAHFLVSNEFQSAHFRNLNHTEKNVSFCSLKFMHSLIIWILKLKPFK